MWLLLGVSVAGGAPGPEGPGCDVAAALATLTARGEREAYDCLIASEEAVNPLLDAWDASPAGESRDRVSRTLTLWLLEHVDGAFNPQIVARLNPADRRLLADGVHARRGRASGSPEHTAVFEKLGWYRPVAGYTDGRLSADDRANIALADRPPPPPAPLVATVAEAPAEPLPIVTPPPEPGWCGCASGEGPAGALWAGAALAAAMARARRPRRS